MSINKVVEFTNVNVTSDRGESILEDVSFELAAGRSLVISGPAGSGKTMLVELLLGLRFPDSGSVEMFGRCLRPRKRRLLIKTRRRIGGVGGVYALVPTLTVAQNVMVPLVLTSVNRRTRNERLYKMLTEFNLLKQATLYPHRLTRVEYTLAQFARASIANQPLLVIDEPAAGLDPATYKRIFEYLVQVSVSGRSMIIMTSQAEPDSIPQCDYLQISDGHLS
jgi:ABC-type lipoprotein export system ATPase subunit